MPPLSAPLLLQEWFKAYPEFAKNPFYMTGESYAGVYIPLAADRIMKGENDINLQARGCITGCMVQLAGVFQLEVRSFVTCCSPRECQALLSPAGSQCVLAVVSNCTAGNLLACIQGMASTASRVSG